MHARDESLASHGEGIRMDPNAALEALRDALTDVETYEPQEALDRLVRVSELFDGLDNWLCANGALPNDWIRSA